MTISSSIFLNTFSHYKYIWSFRIHINTHNPLYFSLVVYDIRIINKSPVKTRDTIQDTPAFQSHHV